MLGIVAVAVACGGDGGSEEARSSGTTSTTETEARPTTTAVSPGSSDADLRILLAGDSVMADLAPAVEAAVDRPGQVDAEYLASSAVGRDAVTQVLWRNALRDFDPQLVVVMIGVWDTQSPDFDRDDDLWKLYFFGEVARFADLMTSTGAPVLWVGEGPTERPELTSGLATLNELFRRVADQRDTVDFYDSGEVLNGPNGGWVESLPDEHGLPERIHRIEDCVDTCGMHLCPPGAIRLAEPVVGWITTHADVQVNEGWPTGSWSEPPALRDPAQCPPVT